MSDGSDQLADELVEDDLEILVSCYDLLQDISIRKNPKALQRRITEVLKTLEASVTFYTLH
jgi:hypothetical protein